jgi:hypothetical protein
MAHAAANLMKRLPTETDFRHRLPSGKVGSRHSYSVLRTHERPMTNVAAQQTSVLRNSASGQEIGLPGWISAEFQSGKPQNRAGLCKWPLTAPDGQKAGGPTKNIKKSPGAGLNSWCFWFGWAPGGPRPRLRRGLGLPGAHSDQNHQKVKQVSGDFSV